MGRNNFLQNHLCFEKQNIFLKIMILFCVYLIFPLLQNATKITSESLIQRDYPHITYFLDTQYDCSEQNNLRQLRVNRVQKGTQIPSEIDFTHTFASTFIRAEAKKKRVFRCSATFQKHPVFCAQGAHNKWSKNNRFD